MKVMSRQQVTDLLARAEIDVDDATQYATVYFDGKPVATLSRKNSFAAKAAPAWRLHDTFGAEVRAFYMFRSYEQLRRDAIRALAAHEVIKA